MTVPLPPGPPFDLDVLADLHAGGYPPDVAAALRARVAADPEATAVLAALDATIGDLRELNLLPPDPIPAPVAARLDVAIAAESAARAAAEHGAGHGAVRTPARPDQTTPPDQATPPDQTTQSDPPAGLPVSSLAAARRARDARRAADRHRRQTRWATGLGIAAAVAAVFTVGAVVLQHGGTSGRGTAGEAPTVTIGPTAPAATGGGPSSSEPPSGNGATVPSPSGLPDLTHAIVAVPHHLEDLLPQIDGRAPQGPLGAADRMAACLAANDAAGEQVLGVLPVSYTGERAYAISLRTAAGAVHILVVGPQCGATGADLLEEQTTG